jgi:ABC-type Zn uptake system ZnuABC Zn-binding protein ZnuA
VRIPAPAVPIALLAVLAAALPAGCGEEGSASGGGPEIVATTSIAADIVRQVTGDAADVAQIVPDGASPHSYALSAREQQELVDSDLVVYFSPALEEGLPIDLAPRRFAFADHVGAGGEDPHVWLDPTLIAAALPDLAATLGEIDPANAEVYRKRARGYADELGDLDRELTKMVETIPPASRKLVTSHDLMGYFAARYGFELAGAPFGLSPEAEASAGRLADLIERIRVESVPAVFAQRGDDPEVLRRVAEEAGVEVVDDLLLESLGAGADGYLEMMEASTAKIVTALGGR